MGRRSSNRLMLTNRRVEDLPLPASGRVIYYDEKVPFLCVQVTDGGAKVFYLYRRIKGKPERVKIGFYPEIGVQTAREIVERFNGMVAAGAGVDDLRPTKAESAVTFGCFFAEWIEQAKQRKKTWQEDVRLFHKHLTAIHGKPLDAVTMKDVMSLHSGIGQSAGKTVANRALALVSVVYSAAETWGGFAGKNPARGVKRFPEVARSRFLQPEEMGRFFAALAEEKNTTMRDFILMLLLTGARKQTLAGMRWADIDLDRRTWRMEEAKTGSRQLLPLVADAAEVLRMRRAADPDGEWVFPSRFGGGTLRMTQPNKAFWRVRDAAGLDDLHIHDLRRSLGSWLAMQGESLLMIGRVLSHQSATSTMVYARLHNDPVRDAMERAVAAMMQASAD